MIGEKTSAHKPLLSAGDVTEKGHALWLDEDVGHIIRKTHRDAHVFRESLFATFVESNH